MAIFESVMASKSGPAIASAQAGQTVTQRGNYEVVGAELEDNANSVRLVKLPAQHRIVSLCLENDDLDSGAALVFDVGIEDTIQDPADTSNSTLFATGVSGQAAGFNRYESAAIAEFGVTNYDRYVTIDVTTGAGTGLAAGIAATLVTRPHLGDQFE